MLARSYHLTQPDLHWLTITQFRGDYKVFPVRAMLTIAQDMASGLTFLLQHSLLPSDLAAFVHTLDALALPSRAHTDALCC